MGALYVGHLNLKVALFLCVGAVFFRTKETNIHKLGGLWRNMPFTAFVMFISLCAISGIPGFNGFASKTMLHHAIVDAYEHSFHILGTTDRWLKLAEWLFMITAGCTFAYNIKLFSFIFLGRRSKKYMSVAPAPASMKIALGILAVFTIFMGLFPNWFLDRFLGPMLSYFGFDPASHAYHIIYNLHAKGGPHSIIPLLYNPTTKAFFSDMEVVHNLIEGSSAILIGGMILVMGLTLGLFLYKTPQKYQVECYYRRLFNGFLALCSLVYKTIVYAGELVIAKLMVYFWMPPLNMENVISPKGNMVDKNFSKSMNKAIPNKGLFTKISNVDERLSGTVDKTIGKKGVFDKVTSADSKFDDMVDKVIFSKLFWGILLKADKSITSGFLKKFINIEKKYDSMMEKTLFGMIGSEDISKIKLERSDFARSWFLNICKKAARIHTGDISNYISWIAIALTVTIVILVGIPYLKTLFAIILAVTLTIFATFILALFFL